MGKIPKVGELAPQGEHKAKCVYVIDEGTQPPPASQPDWEPARKVCIGFELQGVKKKDGKPFYVNTVMTFTMSKRGNLGTFLKGWLGAVAKKLDDFDMDTCLGKDALVEVVHKGGYANITDVSPAKGKHAPSVMKPFSFYLTPEEFDESVLNDTSKIWEKMKERIAASPEYDELKAPKKKGKR
jgi:hypothetical protein